MPGLQNGYMSPLHHQQTPYLNGVCIEKAMIAADSRRFTFDLVKVNGYQQKLPSDGVKRVGVAPSRHDTRVSHTPVIFISRNCKTRQPLVVVLVLS